MARHVRSKYHGCRIANVRAGAYLDQIADLIWPDGRVNTIRHTYALGADGAWWLPMHTEANGFVSGEYVQIGGYWQ